MLYLNITEVFELLLWVPEAVFLGVVVQLDCTVAVGGEGVRMRLYGLSHVGAHWRMTKLKKKKTQDKQL